MKLTSIEIAPNRFELYLDISFSEQTLALLEGKIAFGLKGGLLELKIDNGELTIAEKPDEEREEFSVQSLVREKAWLFSVHANKPILQGSREKFKLGTINITNTPYLLTATFRITSADIYLTNVEGLWLHDISPNKHGILDRRLVFFLLKYILPTCLSWSYLGSENLNNLPQFNPSSAIETNTYNQLATLIEEIYQANTENFLELSAKAGLNPLTDFAGANLLGCELSQINLASANFYRANLRGADLSDADLQETNLRAAKLSGADLTGAYLSNANLANSDLHRASLALANLSSANLTNAELQEANLTNVNWSATVLNGAKFSNNPGIIPEVREILRARGAIFLD